MNAQELIAKLRQLEPETPIRVADSGCGCCTSGDEEGVLVRWTDHLGVQGVVLMHPDDVKRLKPEVTL